MKRWLTFTLTLTILVVFTSLSAAQERKAGEKPAEKPTQGKLPFVGKQQMMTGKVTLVNPAAKTFTITSSNGQAVTFSGARLPTLPMVGQIIDITYTQTPGGPMEAVNLNSSKSNIY